MRSGWQTSRLATRLAQRSNRSVVARAVLVVRAVIVGFVPDDFEVRVEADLDHASVVAADFYAVGRPVVADLGLDDRTAPGVLQRGRRRSPEIRAGQGPIVAAASGN